MEEIIKEVIASAIGALIGGLFTILGVRTTLAYERSKERKKKLLHTSLTKKLTQSFF